MISMMTVMTAYDIIDDCPQGAKNWTSEFQTDKDSDGCEDENSNEDPDDDNDGVMDEFDDYPRGETDWVFLSNTTEMVMAANDNEDNDNDNDGVINSDGTGTFVDNWPNAGLHELDSELN